MYLILLSFFALVFITTMIGVHLEEKRYDKIKNGDDEHFCLNMYNEIIEKP